MKNILAQKVVSYHSVPPFKVVERWVAAGEADLLRLLPLAFLWFALLAWLVVLCTAGPFKCSFFLAMRLNLTMIRIFKMVRVTMGPSLNKVSLTHK